MVDTEALAGPEFQRYRWRYLKINPCLALRQAKTMGYPRFLEVVQSRLDLTSSLDQAILQGVMKDLEEAACRSTAR